MQLLETEVVTSSLFLSLFLIRTVSATGIVIILYFPLLIINVLVFFYPSTSVVKICAGGNYTLTCVTDTGTLVWRVGYLTKTFSNALPENRPSSLGDHITVYATNLSSSVITSVANITGAPVALNGTVIKCKDNDDSKEKVLFVSGIVQGIATTGSYDYISVLCR